MARQATICAAVNAVVNPLLAWVVNRRMEEVPLPAVAVDTVVTCVVLSLLVALLTSVEGAPLPRRGALGLALGLLAACLWTPFVWVVLRALGVQGLPFAAFALFKAAYTAALAYGVTACTLLRAR